MNHLKKHLLLALLISISFLGNAQPGAAEKLRGTWTLDKFEFLSPMPDSLIIMEQAKGTKVSFVTDSKFVAMDASGTAVDSGSYSIEGNYVIQNGEKAEIMELTDTALVVKIPDVMLVYFRREKPVK